MKMTAREEPASLQSQSCEMETDKERNSCHTNISSRDYDLQYILQMPLTKIKVCLCSELPVGIGTKISNCQTRSFRHVTTYCVFKRRMSEKILSSDSQTLFISDQVKRGDGVLMSTEGKTSYWHASPSRNKIFDDMESNF